MAISETITVNAEEAIAQLNAFAEAAARADEAFAKLGKGGGGAGADKLAASMDRAAAAIDAAASRAAAAMGRMSTAGNRAAGGVKALGDAADAAGGGLDKVAAGADAAAAAEDRLAASADAGAAAMDRQAVAGERAGKSAAESGGFFSRHKEAILGTALVMGYAVDKAMKFNSQMTLLHTQAGVAQSGVTQLSTGVLKLAGVTGQSPGNLAESMYHVASNMASMPGTTYAKMLQVVEMAAKGSSIGHSNLVDTTNALTSVVASGIPGVKTYAGAMGMLNATVGSGDMSMQQLAESMASGVVPVVKGYGLNLKDVGATLATYGDLNVRGAQAGTYLRMAVQSLSAPMKSAKTQMQELGLTQNTLSNDMLHGGMLKAVDDLNTRLHKAGYTAANEGQMITQIFGKRAGPGLALILENLDRFHSKYGVLTQDANNFGAAWQATQATPQQKLKELEAGAQALAITAGNVLMPAASGMLGGLNKAMSFVQGNAFASKGIALGAGTLVAGGLAKGLFSGVEGGLSGLGKLGSLLKIPGADKLAGLGQGAGLNGSAVALNGAAANLDAAAAKLGGAGVPGGVPGKVKGAAVGTGEAVAAGTTGETVGLSAGMLAAPVLGAGLGLALGLYLNQYKKYDGPQVAGQLGPHAPAGGIGSQAWKQYDQVSSAPAKMAPPDLSAYTQAKGKAQADGVGVSQGLAIGIRAGGPAAVAAANAVASQVEQAMAHALQTHSPSKKTQVIGANAAQGLVVGLQGGTAAVNAAATALGANAAKAADITTINSTVNKLIGYAPHDTALTKLLKADNSKLVTLANQRAALEAQITDSQQIAQQAISSASITGAGSYTPADVTSNGPLAASATISGMQSMAADQKAFAQQVGQLKSMGLNATSLNQIVQSGASSGLPVAQGLTSGGKGAISQINALEAQIHASAAKLGDEGAGPMYAAGVAAGQGLAGGIKASLGSVDAAMKALSAAMVADLKKDLKISSPSQVFAGFGMAIPQGLAAGVDAGSGIAAAAVGRMGSRAAGAFHPGYSGGSGGSGSGGVGNTVINVSMNIQGSVMSENDLANTVQRAFNKRGNNNWQTGIVLPGRRT